MMFMAQSGTCFSCEAREAPLLKVEFIFLTAFSRTPHALSPRKTVVLTFQHELRRLQPENGGLLRLQGVPPARGCNCINSQAAVMRRCKASTCCHVSLSARSRQPARGFQA